MGQIVFERSGIGFPLVFVHGYLAGAEIWRAQIDHFQQKFDVIVPNLPGFGKSAQMQAPNTIVGFAQNLLDELLSIGVEKFHLVGHSMGGMIVQTMAAMAPDRIDHLVCYGTGPIGVMPDRFETIAQSRLRILEDGIAATVKRIAATWFLDGRNAPGFEKCLELGEKASMQAALASLDAWETWDGRSQLGDIQSPTLVIWGDHDRSYGWNQPEALWRGIENCSLAVVPGCAHNVHMEKSKIFNAILGDFLPTKT